MSIVYLIYHSDWQTKPHFSTTFSTYRIWGSNAPLLTHCTPHTHGTDTNLLRYYILLCLSRLGEMEFEWVNNNIATWVIWHAQIGACMLPSTNDTRYSSICTSVSWKIPCRLSSFYVSLYLSMCLFSSDICWHFAHKFKLQMRSCRSWREFGWVQWAISNGYTS